MQCRHFLDQEIAALKLELPLNSLHVIEGDRYCPILAVVIRDFELPETVLEKKADVTIPFARCAGYLPGSSLAGLHFSTHLHCRYHNENSIIPFCDPVEDLSWIEATARFYPLYDQQDGATLIGSSYLCLHNPESQAESAVVLLKEALTYLQHWTDNVQVLAEHHGQILRGDALGDPQNSMDWLEHLVEHTSSTLKSDILRIAGVSL